MVQLPIVGRVRTMFSNMLRRTTPAKPRGFRGEKSVGGFIIFNPMTHAGRRVDEHNALTLTTVWACVRLISESLASKPWQVWEDLTDGTRERVLGEQAETLLNKRPNREMTAYQFRASIMAHVLLWGNGYAEIERDLQDRPFALWLITPDRVTPERTDDGELVYRVRNEGKAATFLDQRHMLHYAGLGFDGLVGYSVVAYMRQAAGLGLATEEFGASFFGNGAQLSGVLKTDQAYDEEVEKNLIESWRKNYSGHGKLNRTGILFSGFGWERISVPPEDAQFLQTRKHQVLEICRWYRVPPHMVAELEAATLNNIEEQGTEFAEYTLEPWATTLEQESDRKLLSDPTRMHSQISLAVLRRGKLTDRYTAYSTGRQWGYLSANDVRAMEGLPNIGPQGDIYLSPLNMVDARTLVPGSTAPEEGARRTARMMAAGQMLHQIMKRIASREWNRAGELAGKPEKLDKFNAMALEATEYADRALEELAAPLTALLFGDTDRRAETWGAFKMQRKADWLALCEAVKGHQGEVAATMLLDWRDARPGLDATVLLSMLCEEPTGEPTDEAA